MPPLLMPLFVAVLPVLCLLAVLLALDSYKLVGLRWVMALVAAGAVVAGLAYLLNGGLLSVLAIDLASYSRYVAPVTEELLKGLVIALLLRSHRIGFGVDAAIYGFALGAGFAVVENIYIVHLARDAEMVTWVVRGFGTALMHGGATALFAVLGLIMLERHPRARLRAFVPGLAAAALLHSAFNHLSPVPMWATLAVLLVLPPVMALVFARSEQHTRDWLGLGFDSDVRLLELINSGDLPASPMGQYLHTLRGRIKGPLLADMLCYVRLYTELSLRAKGLLMMRENGFEAEPDADAQAILEELRYLERSIGLTGLQALRPLLRMSHKDLWQLFALKRG